MRAADAVVGYGPYVDAWPPLLRPEQLVLRSPMGAEAERAGQACALAAAGWTVALVSSGDPGIFAMASVTLEVAAEAGVDVEVVPGVTAAPAGGRRGRGAPLAGPYAALTLSDLLIPWATIEAQLRAAAGAGMALALFNPRSAGRPDHLARARDVLTDVLDPATPVAVVTDATGPGQDVVRTTLAGLDPTVAGMRSIVLVGTADTVAAGDRLVTCRHHLRQEVTACDPAGPPHRGRELPHPRRAGRPRPLAAVQPGRRGPGDPRRGRRGLRRHPGRGRGGVRGRRRRPAGRARPSCRTSRWWPSPPSGPAPCPPGGGPGRAERERATDPDLTVSAAAMRVAAERWPEGAVVVVGNAPTALDEVVALAAAGRFAPALVIGLPVGFVGAAEAKAALRASGLPAISNVGERGGSAVAAAALNALWRLAQEAGA